MKKVFTLISLIISMFFLSCSFQAMEQDYSISINFGSVNKSRAVTFTKSDLSYLIVSIEPKVQADIKVDIANGETTATFEHLVKGTYKVNVSGFTNIGTKIASGESEPVEVKIMKTNSVSVVMHSSPSPDYSKCMPGDFILKDKSILSKDSTPRAGTVAAVIVRAAEGDKPALGVGIVHEKNGLAWCTKDADGYTASISGLEGTLTAGYIDGSDGWDILKEACSDAEGNPGKYPAWNYSLTYAEKNGLTGYMAEGWYFPTIAELNTIFQNMETVDESLLKAGGDQFEDGWYLSCTVINDGGDFLARQYYFDKSKPNPEDREGDSTRDDGDGYYTCTVKAFN